MLVTAIHVTYRRFGSPDRGAMILVPTASARIAVDHRERGREHRGKRRDADHRSGPVAQHRLVHGHQLCGETAARVLQLEPGPVHDHCAQRDEEDGQDDGESVAEVEVEARFLEGGATACIAILGLDPQRLEDRNLHRRRHPAHQGDEERQGGEVPRRRTDETRLRHWPVQDRRHHGHDGGHREHGHDDLHRTVQRLVVPADEQAYAHHHHHHAPHDRRNHAAEGVLRQAGRDERDAGNRAHGRDRSEQHEGVEKARPHHPIAVEQVFAGGHGIAMPVLEERVLQQVDEQHHADQLEAEVGTGARGLHEVGHADGGTSHEQAGAARLEKREERRF